MTPKQAIKKRCRDCQPENKTDSLCKDCQLADNSISNLKKIKRYCKDFCCNGYNPAVYCNDSDCSLFIYRNGKNPKGQEAQRNNKNLIKTV
ncbi:MAG: hypothetical protein JXB50_14320 [Spirochaetes bacterium]|nr:hypothetical protein [Spirochaetota bacterium]